MPKKVEKALVVYMLTHVAHWLFNELIDEQARKRNWTGRQIEGAKLLVGGLMLVL
ncbi:hypothetical protein [Streptacidiphilus cavernicola]|uniref:Uncharacterized protein n=1 Tax=Streptacidiphilus cavernicola TaxID=3342716 RepID=A0ABV6VYH7_9ACTN